MRRDRNKNLEDKTSGGREGAKGDVKTGRRGGEAEVQEGFLVPPLEQKISLKLVNVQTAFICRGRGSSQNLPPPFTCPPPPWAASITTAVCQAHWAESATASLTSRVWLI